MPTEKALPVPFNTDEIIEIAVAEFKKRLTQQSPLYSGKEYASFKLSYNVRIELRSKGGELTNTLAWGEKEQSHVPEGIDPTTAPAEVVTLSDDPFESAEPNVERMNRSMPLTVMDKKGGTRKVHVKDMANAK